MVCRPGGCSLWRGYQGGNAQLKPTIEKPVSMYVAALCFARLERMNKATLYNTQGDPQKIKNKKKGVFVFIDYI